MVLFNLDVSGIIRVTCEHTKEQLNDLLCPVCAMIVSVELSKFIQSTEFIEIEQPKPNDAHKEVAGDSAEDGWIKCRRCGFYQPPVPKQGTEKEGIE